MVTKKITSLQHPLVLECTKLRENKTFRNGSDVILISGEKMIRELPVEVLFSTGPAPYIKAKESYLVSDQILKKITDLQNPDGFAALVKKPKPQDLSKKTSLLILDQIQDPGNLGTLIRTALALNWEGVIFTPNTVDLFNDKALRAGKGAQFHLPFNYMNAEEISKLSLHLYLADLSGEPISKVQAKSPKAIILSSEGQGAQVWEKARKVTIPMNPQAESLNVAASGAILLYRLNYD